MMKVLWLLSLVVLCGMMMSEVRSEQLLIAELSTQVAETNKALEELLATKLRDIHYASVISELRAEIDSLRRDVVQLKESKELTTTSTTHSSKTEESNEQKTVQWLQNSLAEMRAEIADVNHSVNVSRQMQKAQEAAGAIQLIRSDVMALQVETADNAAHRSQLNESIAELAEYLRRLEAQQKSDAARMDRIETNIVDLRLEVELSRQSFKEEPIVMGLKTKKNERKIRSVDDNQLTTPSVNHNKIRHHRQEPINQHQFSTLKKMIRTLADEQHDLQKQMILLSQMRSTTESNVNKMERELQSILKKVDFTAGRREDIETLNSQNKKLAESVQLLSLKTAGLDQVQSSTLQIFEALERLEERYDESIGQLQKEVSKLEFGDAQIASDVHAIRQDQSGQNEIVKSLRSTATILQEEVQAGQIRSALLMAKLTNQSLAFWNQSRDQLIQDRRLDSLEEKIGEKTSQKDHAENISGSDQLPHDCREYGEGASSGVSYISPRGDEQQVVKVFCDQETSGGGWTVVQRRTDGKEDFNRDWASYKSGFGSVSGEFWLGNDHLHQLTRDNTTMLRVDLWDIYGQYWWAEYDSFLVGSEESGYGVQFAGYTGNASDAMASYHQSMKFSTRDRDQDLSNTNCADSYQGGWWYSHCQHVNINGKYALGLTWYDSLENEWIALARVEMKVRDKRIFSNTPTTGNTQTTTTSTI